MKNSERLTVSELAKMAGRELDETLLILWEVGINNVNEPSDKVWGSKLNLAKRALALPTRRNLTSLYYWQRALSVDENELRVILRNLDIQMSRRARKLPKGAIRKLTQEVGKKSIIVKPIIETPEHVTSLRQPTLEWRTIGHRRNVRLLRLEEVLAIHNALVKDFLQHENPIDPPGPRNEHIIASAVFRQHTAIGKELKYPSVEMSTAALLHSIVNDHPFHNGNKRTALVSMLVLLNENELMLTCHEDELFKLVLQIAQHQITDHTLSELADREVLAIADWIKENVRPIERGDKPIPFRKLRQILGKHGCTFDHSRTGSNMKITRVIKPKKLFSRQIILTTNISYGREGREVARTTVNKVRADLQLDEEHGIDSAAFYEDLPCPVDEFIVKYRKTLNRLAKL